MDGSNLAVFIHNIKIYKGTLYTERLVWTENDIPVNLTGWKAQAQLKGNNQTYSLKSVDGQIQLGTAGEIDLILDASTTQFMEPGVYSWDLLLKNTDGDLLPPLVSGIATVLSIVTQWQ